MMRPIPSRASDRRLPHFWPRRYPARKKQSDDVRWSP
jgi:hypothetical protein